MHMPPRGREPVHLLVRIERKNKKLPNVAKSESRLTASEVVNSGSEQSEIQQRLRSWRACKEEKADESPGPIRAGSRPSRAAEGRALMP